MYFLLIVLTAAGFVFGDECQEFCIAKLGKAACSRGSFCKGSNRVCHSLLWRQDGNNICFHDGIDRTCTSKMLNSVKCFEAEQLATNANPVTTTTTTTTTITTSHPRTTTVSTVVVALRPTRPDRIPRPLPLTESVVVDESTGISYMKLSTLGRGATAEVIMARPSNGGPSVAIKKVLKDDLGRRREETAYQATQELEFFPRLIASFENGQYQYLVISLTGVSIQDFRKTGGGRHRTLPIESIGSIGLQMLDRIEVLHGIGFVHLDMYPNNIARGFGRDSNKLFLIDFGETRSYDAQSPDGQTRRADIRSLSHSLYQMLVPGTPHGDYKHFEDARPRISLEELCRGLPRPIFELFRYSHSVLGVDETPNYDYLRSLLHQLVPGYTGSLVL